MPFPLVLVVEQEVRELPQGGKYLSDAEIFFNHCLLLREIIGNGS